MSDTRDDFLAVIRKERFSVRRCFFNALQRACVLPNGSSVMWPDALLVLSLSDWNAAYEEAMKFKGLDERGAE